MKFTKSRDGVERTSVQVIIRLSREDVARIQANFTNSGNPNPSDKDVKNFARSCVELHLPTSVEDDSMEDDDIFRI